MTATALATIETGQAQDLERATVGQQFLAGQLSEATARAYRADVADFFGRPCEELTIEDLRMVTPAHVLNWRNARMQEQAPATVARKLSSLRSLFRHAMLLRDEDGQPWIEDNPANADLVKSPRVSSESPTEGLTPEEARSMIDAIQGDDLTALRDRAMLMMMLTAGARRAEVVNSDREDVREERGQFVWTVTGKGNKRRKLPMLPEAKRALDDYLAARDDDSPALFVNHARNGHDGKRLSAKAVYRRVKRHAAAAGIDEKKITPHSLRHTFITNCIDGGAPVHRVQYAAGHSEPRTTMRYYRNAENLDDSAVHYQVRF